MIRRPPRSTLFPSTTLSRSIAATMNAPIIFDGRNCLHRDVMRESGFQYYPMGRPPVENALRLKQRECSVQDIGDGAMAAQFLRLAGKRFVLLPETEYRKLRG